MLAIIRIAILAVALKGVVAQPVAGYGCDPDWHHYTGGGYYYIIVHNQVDYNTAQIACRLINVELTSIHSQAEQDFLDTLAGSTEVWIGMDRLVTGSYAWTDGTPYDYMHWSPANPSFGGEHCVHFWTPPGEWNDIDCTVELAGFICRVIRPDTSAATFTDVTGPCRSPEEVTAVVTWPTISLSRYDDYPCVTLSTDIASGSRFNLGDTTVTVSVAFDGETHVLGTFVVTVPDCELPVLQTCDVIAYADPATSSAAVTWSIPGVIDNSDPAPTEAQITGFTSGQTFGEGTTTVTYMATDAAGNSATESFVIEVIDRNECSGEALSSPNGATSKSKITWVPSSQPVLPFQATSICGALGINLYPFPALGTPSYPLITVELGHGQNEDCLLTDTTAVYGYQYVWPKVPTGVTSFRFVISAGSDVHVALSPTNSNDPQMYEIVIGGWANTASGIRLCTQPCPLQVQESTPGIVSGLEYREFYVSFGPRAGGDLVEVSEVVNGYVDDPFMSFLNPVSYDVAYVGISTGYGYTGLWEFCGYGISSSITYYENANEKHVSYVKDGGTPSGAATLLTEYWMSIDENQISVGYIDEISGDPIHPFISLNKNSIDIWAALDIRYVEVYGWDGSEYMSSIWCFEELDSLASNADLATTPCMTPASDCGLLAIDDDLGTCFLSQASSPSYLQIDLGMEYNIIGITLYHAESTNLGAGNIVGEEVFVGSCLGANREDIETNVGCSEATSSSDLSDVTTSNIALYRACPFGTFGRYVYLVSNNPIDLCEIKVHGIEILEADRPVINFESANYNVIEESPTLAGTGSSLSVRLLRTGGLSEVSLTCADVEIKDKGSGSAASGVDYVAYPTTTVSFVPGETDVTIPPIPNVDILPDALVEESPYETIELELVDEETGQTQTVIITIIDEDPLYSFDIQEASIAENDASGRLSITVTRSKYTDTSTTVHIDTSGGTATSEESNPDYTGLTSEPLVFAAVETQKTIEIQIHDDLGLVDSEDETFDVILDATTVNRGTVDPTGGIVTVTITNDDTVYGIVNAEPLSVIESDEEFSVLVNRIGKIDNIGYIGIRTESVSSQPAEAGGDYQSVNAVVTFPANVGTTSVEIPIVNDLVVETEENLNLVLYLPDSNTDESPIIDNGDGDAGVTSKLLAILDDDNTYSVTSKTNIILESAGSVTVSFSRNNAGSSTATIEINVSGATSVDTSDPYLATEGVDFNMTGRHQVVFESYSNIAEFTIPIIQDTDVEYDEEFYVDITKPAEAINGGRSRTTVIIQNDEAYITVDEVEITLSESVGSFQLILHRGPFMDIQGYLDNDVTIVLSTNTFDGDTAISGYDFEPFTKTVTFYGSSREFSKTCEVTIIDDELVEGIETFTVSVSGSENIAPSSRLVKITIVDDDGRFAIEISNTNIFENQGEFEFRVTRTDVQQLAYAVVDIIGLSAIQGQDFHAQTYELTFLPGESFKTGTVSIIDDTEPEDNEMLRIVLREADGEIDGDNQEMVVTIVDNDVTTFGFEETSYDVGESCKALEVEVIRQGSGQEETTIRLTALNGGSFNGATYPEDFRTRDVILTFLPNQSQRTATIDIASDSVDEGEESFTLSLSLIGGPGQIHSSDSIASVTIQDQPVRYAFRDTYIEVVESDGHVTLEVIREGDVCDSSNTDQHILISSKSSTAIASEDFISFSKQRLAFNKDQSTVTFDVNLINDVFVEYEESFEVKIVDPDDGDNTVTIHVLDDDSKFSFLKPVYETSESMENVEITIERIGNVITEAAAVVRTSGGNSTAYSDYAPIQNVRVEFAPEATSASFTVEIFVDDDVESDETFDIEMTSVTHGDITSGRTTVVIAGDGQVSNSGGSSMFIIGIASGIGGLILVITIGSIACLAIMRASQPAVAYPRGQQQMALFNQNRQMNMVNRRQMRQNKYLPAAYYPR